MMESMGVGIEGGRLASRPYQRGVDGRGGMNSCLWGNKRGGRPAGRPYEKHPAAAPITLTSILSQDGRGGGLDSGFRRNDGYAKVSRMGEEVRGRG